MRNLTLQGKLVVFGIVAVFTLLILLIVLGVHRLRAPGRDVVQPGGTGGGTETVVSVPQSRKALPVRKIPSKFRRNTHLPKDPEGKVSGGIDPTLFSAGRDLVYVDDSRVYWESDNDKNDDECDHSMHKSMAAPLRLLIELVSARGGTLEVQDAYRPCGIHNKRSLHKEGRAVDLTCDELGLEKLACLAWGAGFDWVYYEASAKGGAHVHCSVKRDHVQPTP
jgi:hypothetical protein